MKRSEFIKKLVAKISWLENCKLNKEAVGEILKEIEKLGMLPPRISEEAAQATMHLYYAGYSLNRWDEDLEKDEAIMAVMKSRAEAAKKRQEKVEQRRRTRNE